MTNTQIRAGVYLRQSQDLTGEGLAVDRQRKDCLRLCHQKGWEPVEYVENNTSASRGRRPVYQSLMDDIRSGAINAVVAWDADRLHRIPRELEDFIDTANQYGIALATIGGEFDLSTPTGRANARLRGVFARMEMEQKSARQKLAAKQLAESGKPWGPRAFGYTEKTNQLEPAEADAVRDAYVAVLAGSSLYSIASQWNAAGITTTKGNQWTGATVRQVLVNPRYAGLRAYRGEIVGEGNWPAIVDRAKWEGVRALLTDPNRRRGSAGRKHLLSGLLLCGRCGKPMSSGIAYRSDKPNYVCKRLHLARLQEPVDTLVTSLVVAYLSRPDAAEILLDRDRPDITELAEQAEGLRAEAKSLAALLGKGQITAEQFAIANSGIMQRLEDVEAKQQSSQRLRVFKGLVGSADVRAAWDALTLDRKRAVIENLIEVTLLPAGRGTPFTRDHLAIRWLTAED